MNSAAVIKDAAADGVMLSLSSTGTVKANGDSAAVNRWLPLIREHKAAIVELLAATPTTRRPVVPMTAEQEAAIRAWLTFINETDSYIIADTLERCRIDTNVLTYFVMRSAEVPKPPYDLDDDRIRCTQCVNLTPRGRCQAAQRGEINRTSRFEPMIDKPQRCVGYAPGPDDPDRRRGSERWNW